MKLQINTLNNDNQSKVLPKEKLIQDQKFKIKMNFINDYADAEYDIKNQQINQINLKKSEKITKINVISPDGSLRLTIEFLSLIIIFQESITIPLYIFFESLPTPDEFQHYQDFIFYWFWFTMALQFNIGFYRKGILINDRFEICKQYLSGWFTIDLISNLDFEKLINSIFTQVQNNNNISYFRLIKLFRILRLLRAVRIQKTFKKLFENIHISKEISSIYQFMKLILITAMVAHYIACIYTYVLTQEIESYQITSPDILDKNWLQLYIYQMYWSVTTMITVGYGDIVPVTTNQRVFAILAMLISSGVFGYVMNRVGYIFQSFAAIPAQYSHSLNQISQYMKKRSINKDIQLRVRQYLDYLLKTRGFLGGMMDEQELHNLLSQQLKDEIIEKVQGQIIDKNKTFQNLNFSSFFIKSLPYFLKEYQYSPSEILIKESNPIQQLKKKKNQIYKEQQSKSLYIVTEGGVYFQQYQIQVFIEQTNTLMNRYETVGKKSHIVMGIIEFFADSHFFYSIQTTTFSTIFELSLQDFINELKFDHHRYDREIYFQLKHQIDQNKNISDFKKPCFVCSNIQHTEYDCPCVHFIPNISLVIKKSFTREVSNKIKFKRFQNKYNSRKLRRSIRSDMLIPDYKIPNTSLYNEKGKVNLEINNKVFQNKLVL